MTATPAPEAQEKTAQGNHVPFGQLLRESLLEANTFTVTVLALVGFDKKSIRTCWNLQESFLMSMPCGKI